MHVAIFFLLQNMCDFSGAKPCVDNDPRSLKYSNAHGKINWWRLLEASDESTIEESG